MNGLTQNIDKLHTTPMGAQRIKRNLNLQTDDVVAWCKEAVINADIMIGQGKNWYSLAGFGWGLSASEKRRGAVFG